MATRGRIRGGRQHGEGHVRRLLVVAMVMGSGLIAGAVRAQKPPLLPENEVAALANELSGETAKRNLEGIARFHRQRGSKGFHEAAELVAERLRAYGLSDVAILQFPADGKIFYGTQRSRPAWDAEVGELWEVKEVNEVNEVKEKSASQGGTASSAKWMPSIRVASYEAEPVVLAEDSESADVTADLVDVGDGTKESDYAGKDVKGKIVLVSAQPGAVQDLAAGKFGAAGIVSYAQNQKTAWWGENENLIRWGHLETFSPNKTYAFMVSLKTARGMRERLAHGEKIRLHAVVKAGQHAGNYEEVAPTLQTLINEGKLTRPARTIRFIFPPEIEGTMSLLNGKPMQFETRSIDYTGGKTTQLPPSEIHASVSVFSGAELAKRIKAVVHMDMVGGGPET